MNWRDLRVGDRVCVPSLATDAIALCSFFRPETVVTEIGKNCAYVQLIDFDGSVIINSFSFSKWRWGDAYLIETTAAEALPPPIIHCNVKAGE